MTKMSVMADKKIGIKPKVTIRTVRGQLRDVEQEIIKANQQEIMGSYKITMIPQAMEIINQAVSRGVPFTVGHLDRVTTEAKKTALIQGNLDVAYMFGNDWLEFTIVVG